MELEELKKQWDGLSEQLKKQQVLNHSLINRAMNAKMGCYYAIQSDRYIVLCAVCFTRNICSAYYIFAFGNYLPQYSYTICGRMAVCKFCFVFENATLS